MTKLKIDREGFVLLENELLKDNEQATLFLKNLHYNELGNLQTRWGDELVPVEVFDQPILAIRFKESSSTHWTLEGRHGFEATFALESITVDDWDRFHGRTLEGIPFVMNRSAQEQFFDLLDSFDDDGFCYQGQQFKTDFWLNPMSQKVDQAFWTPHYEQKNWPWDLGAPHPALESILAQLKLNKLRILVLGCGRGHDAAFLASRGHIVTALDFEVRAIAEAKTLYPHSKVHWLQKDLFQISSDWHQSFDLIFEHTCYCAIDPLRRTELVKLWSKLLVPKGHLLGLFFAMDKPHGPPFGGSEWEVYHRLKPYFEPRYWTRWEHSTGRRKDKELIVFAEKVEKR